MNTFSLSTRIFLLALMSSSILIYGFYHIKVSQKQTLLLDKRLDDLNTSFEKISNSSIINIKYVEDENIVSPVYRPLDRILKRKLLHPVEKLQNYMDEWRKMPIECRVVEFWPLTKFHHKNNRNNEGAFKGEVLTDSLHLYWFSSILHSAQSNESLSLPIDVIDSLGAFILINTNKIAPTSNPPRKINVKSKFSINDTQVDVISVLTTADSSKYILLFYDTSNLSKTNTLIIDGPVDPHQKFTFKREDIRNKAFLLKN